MENWLRVPKNDNEYYKDIEDVGPLVTSNVITSSLNLDYVILGNNESVSSPGIGLTLLTQSTIFNYSSAISRTPLVNIHMPFIYTTSIDIPNTEDILIAMGFSLQTPAFSFNFGYTGTQIFFILIMISNI